MTKADILKALVRGERISEREFDLIFPREARKYARAEWTPLEAARRAAALLVTRPGMRVLDVGAGGGKFCIVGAATTAGNFTGVEMDPELVQTARDVVRELKLSRVKFVHGDALALDWNTYDALYLFNPFVNSAPNEMAFVETMAAVTRKLASLPAGTVVVTYHGFGGTMPPDFVQGEAEFVGPGLLQRWVKEK